MVGENGLDVFGEVDLAVGGRGEVGYDIRVVGTNGRLRPWRHRDDGEQEQAECRKESIHHGDGGFDVNALVRKCRPRSSIPYGERWLHADSPQRRDGMPPGLFISVLRDVAVVVVLQQNWPWSPACSLFAFGGIGKPLSLGCNRASCTCWLFGRWAFQVSIHSTPVEPAPRQSRG